MTTDATNIVARLKARLKLQPHPAEGGFFVETYRSNEEILRSALPDRYDGSRSLGTAIYYLLTPETFSAIHRLRSDEIFHFYLGDPVELLQLDPDGSGKVWTLGAAILDGMLPQVVVPRGVWQGLRLRPAGAPAGLPGERRPDRLPPGSVPLLTRPGNIGRLAHGLSVPARLIRRVPPAW